MLFYFSLKGRKGITFKHKLPKLKLSAAFLFLSQFPELDKHCENSRSADNMGGWTSVGDMAKQEDGLVFIHSRSLIYLLKN